MVAATDSASQPRPTAAHVGSGAGARVLVLEDDKGLAKMIQRKLRRHGFRFEAAPSSVAVRELLDLFRPDLLLLDLDTADPDGFDLISDIRACSALPIIAVSSQATERDAVAALERGADDFIAKPFGLDELLARIRVGLRHVAKPDSGTDPVMRAGELQLNIERRQVLRNGQLVHLTPTEYRLLKLFATHPDRFLPDRWLMNEIWGPSWRGGEHILHVYVGRLRRLLEPDPARPRFLLTESGVGYRLAAAGD
jgi:two-component system, OmpR family, KDP operon response regulator KdpE